MVKITYTDPSDNDAPKVTWHGVVFRHMVPTEVDPALKPELVKDARTHPYFVVEEPVEEPPWNGEKQKAPEEPLPALPKAAAKK